MRDKMGLTSPASEENARRHKEKYGGYGTPIHVKIVELAEKLWDQRAAANPEKLKSMSSPKIRIATTASNGDHITVEIKRKAK